MLESLILYFFVIWTSLLSVVVRAKQRLFPLPPTTELVQAPQPQIEADASPTLSFTTLTSTADDNDEHNNDKTQPMPAVAAVAAPAAAPMGASKAPAYPGGIKAYFQAKIEATELTINERTQNLRRLEAQRNALNARGTRFGRRTADGLTRLVCTVRLLREELQLLMEPGSYVGEVVKVMGKTKTLVKVQPEGKYSESDFSSTRWCTRERCSAVLSKCILKPQGARSIALQGLLASYRPPDPFLQMPFYSCGSSTVVDVDPEVDINKLTPTLRVALRSDSYLLHKILPNKVDPLVSLMMVEKVPDSTYEMVGGLDKQIKEIKEVIELPVKHPELFDALGIAQPKGVLLYGPPGTGKTLLARAVAHHTDCKFIRVSGSELVQKYIGEGSRMVRELFVMAREHAPSIIFMDEIDSIGSSRGEGGASNGDSEVQRTMLELLNQLDGFEPTKNIKVRRLHSHSLAVSGTHGCAQVIMATNRIDILDSALLRPGRIDRKIEFPPPGPEARISILRIHSRKVRRALMARQVVCSWLLDVPPTWYQLASTRREDGAMFWS